jgi:CubicO group peptidase (beta-lactamase class C family)
MSSRFISYCDELFHPKKFKVFLIIAALSTSVFLLATDALTTEFRNQESSLARINVPAQVDTVVEGLLNSTLAEGVPGAIIHVSTPFWEGTWTEGTADLAENRPITPSDTFRIASITKTFTATVVLQLIDEGVLSLENTLNDFNDGFGVPLAAQITIRQLLSHTSGLADWTASTEFQTSSCSQTPAGYLLIGWSPQSMVDMAISVGHSEPDTGYEYEDTNYILLGMIVEWATQSAVTGTRLPEEIRNRILIPLGLAHTTYPLDSVMPSPSVHGYWIPGEFSDLCPNWSGYTGLTDGTDYNPAREFGCGAMISTLADLKTWCAALAHGTLISEALHQEQLTWGLWPASSGGYGLGIMSVLGAIGHGGDLSNGFSSGIYYLPARQACIIVLLNSEAVNATYLAAQLIANIFPPAIPPHPADGDYNEPGKSKIALFRRSSGLWAVRGLGRVYFGGRQDIPVPGDYDGDGYTDITIFRPLTGLWAIKNITRLYFGSWQDIPIPGDYNGDGSCDITVLHDVTGYWRVREITRFYFGLQFDQPLPGDYNGNGTDEAAIFRSSTILNPSVGLWAIRGITRFYYGAGGDLPVPSAYRWYGHQGAAGGPFRKQAGIFRPSSGLWAIRGSTRIYFGRSMDQPIPADYGKIGTDQIGIFRESSGLWAVRELTRIYYGKNEDLPITR